MKRRKLLWQLYPSYLVIILLAVVALGWYASSTLRDFYYQQTADSLEHQAHYMGELIGDRFDSEHITEVDALCDTMGPMVANRITIIALDGTVLGDSEKHPRTMENHGTRPEILEAYKGQRGISIRFSNTLQTNMMYVTHPMMRENRIVGVVRVAMAETVLDETLNDIYVSIAVYALLIALFAALFSLFFARRVDRHVATIKEGAIRFAHSDLEYRFEPQPSDEMNALAESMNHMAEQLLERINTITSQRNEIQAVLSSMVEAVLVVDTDRNIVRMNTAAASLFNCSASDAKGRPTSDVVHDTDLLNFIDAVLETREYQESHIVFGDTDERFLHANGTILRDAGNQLLGALVVLNDVTRLEKLENIRRDFVANVSHELKTPITSIKGFVETLKDGAMEDRDSALRFLDIIVKHTDRLTAIIEDLLALSRIEQESDQEQIPVTWGHVKDVLDGAVMVCRSKAMEKNIAINLSCDAVTQASYNALLVEQAVVNLIDNAIKYSERGGSIDVSAHTENGALYLAVKDTGAGIPQEHLPRLFERFYRVDKARSRKLGGTGLGLAIVKHIVQAHGGAIEVESVHGEGSTFTIKIPISR